MSFNPMEISFKKIGSEYEFEIIKCLYLSAFPPNERREYAELVNQLYAENCVVNLITDNRQIAGFFIFWDFGDFTFLEHFAIETELRGQGIGERVLVLFKENVKKPIFLETEPPNNEMNKRRVNFYLRNGFHLLNRQYFQPSYDGIKPEVEMILLSNISDYSEVQLDNCISVIREKVYNQE
jgi:ribosomal protein S18 acetylase RimI-like enzyme